MNVPKRLNSSLLACGLRHMPLMILAVWGSNCPIYRLRNIRLSFDGIAITVTRSKLLQGGVCLVKETTEHPQEAPALRLRGYKDENWQLHTPSTFL